MKMIHVHVKFVVKVPEKTDVKNDLMVDVWPDGKLHMHENGGTRDVRFRVESASLTKVKQIP
jgi:hypothetical protein